MYERPASYSAAGKCSTDQYRPRLIRKSSQVMPAWSLFEPGPPGATKQVAPVHERFMTLKKGTATRFPSLHDRGRGSRRASSSGEKGLKTLTPPFESLTQIRSTARRPSLPGLAEGGQRPLAFIAVIPRWENRSTTRIFLREAVIPSMRMMCTRHTVGKEHFDDTILFGVVKGLHGDRSRAAHDRKITPQCWRRIDLMVSGRLEDLTSRFRGKSKWTGCSSRWGVISPPGAGTSSIGGCS
jgi:hypothetical protein